MMYSKQSDVGISPVVGIAILVAIAVVMSALVFAFTGGFMTEQQAPSAGANVNIASETVIEVQLDSVQNADNVYVQSPLGTKYKFDGIGDTVEILNIGNEQKPVVIAEKDGKEHVVQGITPRSFDADVVVAKDGTGDYEGLQEAINKSSFGDTIVVKRDTYSTVEVSKSNSKIVAEHGTDINGDVTVSGDNSTFSNFNVDGQTEVSGENTHLAKNEYSQEPTYTGDASEPTSDESSNELIRSSDLSSSSSVTPPIYKGSGDTEASRIVRSSNGSEDSGVINATTYKIEEGVTRTVNGKLIIHATDKIVINGHLRAISPNHNGMYFDGGNGGGGGGSPPGHTYPSSGDSGEAGGNSVSSVPSETQVDSISSGAKLSEMDGWSEIYETDRAAGSGGGDGGDGSGSRIGGDGGSGGSGGGTVLLVAPEIEIKGAVTANGHSGSDGEWGDWNTGGGGGGGGGSGGLVYLVSSDLTETGNVTAHGGGGGDGGGGADGYRGGGSGGNGQDGQVYRITVEG